MKKPSNNSLVLFVGAGASARLGFPTTVEFIRRLGQQNRWPQLGTLLDVYREYTSYIEGIAKNQVPADSEYIRDWLLKMKQAALRIESIAKAQPFNTGVASDNHAFELMDKLLVSFDTSIRQDYGESEPNDAYRHYFPLLNALNNRGINFIPVFTTNYDLVFESIQDYENNNWHIETGMRQTGRIVILDKKIFSRLSPRRPQLVLFKLHGSIDWWSKENSNQIERIPIGYNAPSDYKDLLIYPTREKFGQLESEPFSFFYNKFKHYLSLGRTSLCITIGYSFRDSFINEVFAQALLRGMRLVILDNNQDTGHLYKQFSEYSISDELIQKQVNIVKMDFGSWSDRAIVTLNDVLDKEVGRVLEEL